MINLIYKILESIVFSSFYFILFPFLNIHPYFKKKKKNLPNIQEIENSKTGSAATTHYPILIHQSR